MKAVSILKYLGCGCLITILLIVCICAGISCWVCSKILTPTPVPLPLPEFKKEAFQSAYMKLLPLPQTIKNSKEGQVETISLSSDEINAIIILSTHKDCTGAIIMTGKIPESENAPKNPYSIIFSKGEFQVYANRELPFSTPFGRYFVFRTAFVPSVYNSEEKVSFKYGQIGNINIPEFALESIMTSYLNKFDENPESAKVKKVILHLKSDESGLNIQYHPHELNTFIEQYIKSGPMKMLWNSF